MSGYAAQDTLNQLREMALNGSAVNIQTWRGASGQPLWTVSYGQVGHTAQGADLAQAIGALHTEVTKQRTLDLVSRLQPGDRFTAHEGKLAIIESVTKRYAPAHGTLEVRYNYLHGVGLIVMSAEEFANEGFTNFERATGWETSPVSVTHERVKQVRDAMPGLAWKGRCVWPDKGSGNSNYVVGQLDGADRNEIIAAVLEAAERVDNPPLPKLQKGDRFTMNGKEYEVVQDPYPAYRTCGAAYPIGELVVTGFPVGAGVAQWQTWYLSSLIALGAKDFRRAVWEPVQ